MTSSLSQMEPELQSIRVLHVDDEPDVAELTATYLKRKDDRFSIEAATSAADGLTQLAEGTFDCIISDYDMPGQNGIQFLTKVRDEYPEIPFILFTGKGSEEVASEAISAGVTDYLQKESGTEQYELLANRVLNAVDGHRTQQLAQEQTRQLETLISNLPGMVYRCRNDPAWPMETVDGDVEDLTGYRADRLEDNDVLWGTEIIHPDDREPMWNTVQEGLSGDGSFEVTYRIVTKNGTTKWMWERGRGIYSADGDLEALEGFITDITEQQEREQELEETNAVLSTVFETATVGILAEDENRNVLTVNERALELFEIPDPPDTVVGTDCERLAAQLSDQFVGGDRFVNRINELVANRTPVDQEVLSVSDGRTFERSYRPLELPDGNGHLWVYQDVTDREDRREMTRDLQQQAQDLIRAETTEAVAETTVEIAEQTLWLPFTGVHLIGDNPNVLEPVAVSDGVRKQLGTAPRYDRTTPSRTIDEFNWAVFEAGDPVVIDDIEDVDSIDAAETPTRSGLVYPLGDHGIFVTTSPEPNAFDKTDRYLTELLATILTAVLDRVDHEMELEMQKQRLRAERDRLDEFASIVSHDLQNPLGVAEGHLELVQEKYESDSLDAIAKAHDRMESLIDDLLALAREGDKVTDPEPVNLDSLTEACWQTVETGDATLVTEAERTIRADRSRLAQVLENLFRNAVEHGGDDVTIRVGDIEEGFYVEDDGGGIPVDEQEQIFDAGYTTSDEGTGFGLPIVRQIVDAHGWTVRVTNGSRGGTRFEITGVEFSTE